MNDRITPDCLASNRHHRKRNSGTGNDWSCSTSGVAWTLGKSLFLKVRRCRSFLKLLDITMTGKMVRWNRRQGSCLCISQQVEHRSNFFQHCSSAQEYTGRPYPITSEQAVLKIPDNDTEDSSFESRTRSKRRPIIQFNYLVVVLISGRRSLFPPRINIF